MSKKYRSAMDEIKMSDALKKRIVKASAQKKKRRKLIRPVYISAAAGLAACFAIVITLHHASVTKDERVTATEFETAQASEIPYNVAAEDKAAESVTEPTEKTSVAKADTKIKTDAGTRKDKTAKVNEGTLQGKTESITESAQAAVTGTTDSAAAEPETNEQPEASAAGSETDTVIEAASANAAEDTTEITVAKAVERKMPEAMPEDAAEPPSTSVRRSGGGGGTAPAASVPMPQPTEAPTEDAADENQ
ncbi:MAG: hypothetical protein IJH94_06760 [Clostridia bacterium]|nr:hypothetical protein [Clostridia bacterium]